MAAPSPRGEIACFVGGRRAWQAFFHPGINETTPRPAAADPYYRLADPYYGYSDTSRPTVADPYYRLSDSYYGYSDPYRGLYDLYAVPPYNPGYSYGHVRPGGWR